MRVMKRPPQLLDRLLAEWPFDPRTLSVRMVRRKASPRVIQMRVELGILQLEMEGRPDGTRPFGFASVLDYVAAREETQGDDYTFTEEERFECDREFVQYYHRRIAWLSLQNFGGAMRDARHTLALMDCCRRHSPSEDWTITHEQYRPFVLYHRIHAESLHELSQGHAAEAIEVINRGIPELQGAFQSLGSDAADDHEMIPQLTELRETLRERFEVGRTLQEQLTDAIAAEQYEVAARLRDAMAKQHPGQR